MANKHPRMDGALPEDYSISKPPHRPCGLYQMFVKRASLTTAAFSLIELLVASAIFAVILILVLSIISQSSGVWRRSSDQIQAFKDARLAFEVLTRNLSQATLNTYLDYDSVTAPSRYLRRSELKFLSDAAGTSGMPGTKGCGQAIFFLAPGGYTENSSLKGMASLLNTCGYFVEFGSNQMVPSFVSANNNPSRYRLVQAMAPTEMNSVYRSTGKSWISAATDRATPIADNIIALICRPQDPGTVGQSPSTPPNDKYAYDSKENENVNPQPVTANQLPPVIHVTMIAIDENSAKRLDAGSAEPNKIRDVLEGKFAVPASYEDDLSALTDALTAQKINYRVFSSAIPIRETKWTK